MATGLVACLGSIALLAAPVDENAARDIAAQFAARAPQLKSSRPVQPTTLTTAYVAARMDGSNAYYVFNRGKQGGYIIVSGDDRAEQVLGYSTRGSFCYDSIPPAMRWWLGQYRQQMEHLSAQPDPQAATQQPQAVPTLPARQLHPVSGQPQMVRASGAAVPKSATKATDSYLAPLLGNIAWDQGEPYNNLCPTLWSGERAATGCVATAMAQIMDYYLWPAQGNGSHSYTCQVESGNTRTLSADFGNTRYDWSNMLTSYAPGQYTSTQSQAVATLMYHCGVSVDMIYGPSSGASSIVVPHALYTYFNYDGDMSYKQHAYYSDAEWEGFVRTELNASRPVYYSGRSDEGGHAFVCDGYDDNGYYHFNWGWSGYYNGYFLLDALNPEGQGIGGYEGGYNQDHAIVTGIQPDAGNLAAEGELCASGIRPATTSCRKGDVFEIYAEMHNLNWNDLLDWELTLQIYDKQGKLTTTLPTRYSVNDLEPGYGYVFNAQNGGYQEYFPESLTDGEYKIIFAYRTARNNTWREVLTDHTCTNCVKATVSGQNVTFVADADWSKPPVTPDLIVLANETTLPPDKLLQHQDNPFSVTLLNNGATFTGEVQALLYDEDAASLYEDYYQVIGNVSLNMGEKTTLHFDWNVGGLAPGRYIFQLAAINDDGTYKTSLRFNDGTWAAYYIDVEENAELALTIDWQEAGDWPLAVSQYTDFTIETTLHNNGTAFSKDIYAVLFNDEGNILYKSQPTSAAVAPSGEKHIQLTVNVDDLSTGEYWLGWMYYEGGKPYLIPNSKGNNSFQITVFPLSLATRFDETVISRQVHPYEDFEASTVLINTGQADFRGNVVLVLQDADQQAVYQSANVQVEVAANGGTAPAAWTCNVGDLPAGVYDVRFALLQQDGMRLYLPFNPESNLTVEVVKQSLTIDWQKTGDWPLAVYQYADFTIETSLRNYGTVFSKNIYAVLFNDDGNILYESQPAFTTITSSGEKHIQLTANVGDLSTGKYWLGWIYYEGGKPYLIPNSEGNNSFRITVFPLSLTVRLDETEMSRQIHPHKDFQASTRIANEGEADFHGSIVLVLLDADQQVAYQSTPMQVKVAANGNTAPTTWTCNVGDLPAGMYDVQFALLQQDGTRLYLPFSPEGNLTLEVTRQDDNTGLHCPKNNASIRLWPNPATDRVHIACPTGITRIRLHSPDGTLLTEQPGDGSPTCSLDVNRLSPGLYLLTVTTPDGTRTGRLVVE